MLDQESLYTFEGHCTQESPPRCRTSCPFDLDVRAFLAQLARGKTLDARKILERHVPLPGIMAFLCDHPCEQRCLRRDAGGSIALHNLELFCMLSSEYKETILPLPPKRFRMAILGAGLAALTAAWDLSRKAYPVTVFHAGERSAALLQSYPLLSQNQAAKFLTKHLEDLSQRKVVFKEATFSEELVQQLSSDFDCVLMDCDACKAFAPKRADVDQATLVSHDNVVCAGWQTASPTGALYREASLQAGEGRFAAQTMERLAAGLSLTAERKKVQGPLHTDLSEIAHVPRVEPRGALYSAAEASAEAGRCLQCACLLCVKNCVYLQKFKGYPRIYARQVHNNASIVKGLHTANALINGCALCGQCTELCPENFSMADLCLMARKDMVKRSVMPPSAHEFALEDMESASGECSLTFCEPKDCTPSYLFFPGCQLAASRGAQVLALWEWLCQSHPEGIAIMLSCCGIPAHWAGQEELFTTHMDELRRKWEALGRPKILTACSSCMIALRLGLSSAEISSVWELLDKSDLASLLQKEKVAQQPKVFSIHDPCTARHLPSWQQAVRSLAHKAGCTIEEPKYTGAQTACCGYGGLVWCAQPETANAMAQHRTQQLSKPALASCIMCRDRFVAEGKECWHILDLLFPNTAQDAGTTPGPTLSARRANRAKLRAQLLYGHNLSQTTAESLHLHMDADLLARLEERHILLSDVEAAIAGCEEHGQWFLNTENGHRLGSFKPRNVTFWVEYAPREEGFYLFDAWCHRMIVPGSGGAEADEVIKAHQYCTDGSRGGHA